MDIVIFLKSHNERFILDQQHRGEGFLKVEEKSHPKNFDAGNRVYLAIKTSGLFYEIKYVALCVEYSRSFTWVDKYWPEFSFWVKWVDLREADSFEAMTVRRSFIKWQYATVGPTENQCLLDRVRYTTYQRNIDKERAWENGGHSQPETAYCGEDCFRQEVS